MNSDTQCIDITIVDDDLVEPTEEFKLVLVSMEPFVDIDDTDVFFSIFDNDEGIYMCAI